MVSLEVLAGVCMTDVLWVALSGDWMVLMWFVGVVGTKAGWVV